MTPIAYALAVYREARRRAGVCPVWCPICASTLHAMIGYVAEEAARRKR
mgnify:CR=1 FL=1